MRWSALLLILALGGVAHAEKVKTNQSAKVYSHAGEAGEVLTTVKAGQAMTVLSKDGRWLKVRVNGRTGYVPRSKVDMPEGDDDVQRNTRRRPFVDGRSTSRGFSGGGGPDDRVGADATGAGGDDGDKGDKDKDKGDDDGDKGDKGDKDDDKPKHDKPKHEKPRGKGHDDDVDVSDDGDSDKGDKDKGDKDDDKDSDKGDKGAPEDTRPVVHVTATSKVLQDPKKGSEVAFKAKPDDKLFIEDKKGKWTEVSMEEGDEGWILTSQLDLDSAGIGTRVITKREIDLRARAGVSIIQEALRTAGNTTVLPPANYNLASTAAVLALGGQYLMPYQADYVLGAELAYDYNKAGGVAFMGQTTSFAYNNFNLRFEGGYDLHKSNGMTVLAHLGYKYQSFLVSNVSNLTTNTEKIPSEVFKGPTIGAALWLPRLTPKIGLRGSLDVIVAGGSVTQTKNLEEGTSPSGKAADLGVQFTYRWKPGLDLQATYDLNYAGMSFGAPLATSQQMNTGTSVSRTDIFHTVTFGIAKSM
jgi:SH3-like domain-containing protein